MLYETLISSPLGPLTLAGDEEHLIGIWMAGQKYYGATLPPETRRQDNLPVFDSARDWLRRYFAGERPGPHELPLAPQGSAFRRAVWTLLCEIPYGETVSYGALAHRLAAQGYARQMSAQAVGGAVGHNPISIVIPCHRVVGANGSLTGYAGGVDKKLWLLRHEGAQVQTMTVPRSGSAI